MNVFELFAKVSVNKSQAVNDIRAIETAGKKTSVSMGANFQKLGDNVGKWIKRGAVVAAGAVAALGATSLKNFAKMDTGMREVFTLMPGLSEKAKEQMTADVKEISRAIGVLPNETIPALYQAISAGVPPDNVFDFMEIAGKAAKAGVTDLETSVDALSSVVNAYGAEVLSATEASDIMFTAVRLGKTTFAQLSRYLFQVTPVAAATGVSFQQVAAAMAEITAKGVPTRVAATQLRQMLVELSRSGGELAEIFEELSGQTFQDFMDEGNDLSDVLELLQEYTDANSISLMDMFSSVEGGMAALNLGGSNLDSFRVKLGEMSETAEATEIAFAEMTAGIQFRLDQLAAWWQTVQINIGEELQGGLSQFLGWLEANQARIETGLIKMFKGLLDGLQWLITNRSAIKKVLAVVALGLIAIYAITNPVAAAIALLVVGISALILKHEQAKAAAEAHRKAMAEIEQMTTDYAEASEGAALALAELREQTKLLREEQEATVAGPSATLGDVFKVGWDEALKLTDALMDLTDQLNELEKQGKLSRGEVNAIADDLENAYRIALQSPTLEEAIAVFNDLAGQVIAAYGEDIPEALKLTVAEIDKIAASDGATSLFDLMIAKAGEGVAAFDAFKQALEQWRDAQRTSFASVEKAFLDIEGPITSVASKIREAYRGFTEDLPEAEATLISLAEVTGDLTTEQEAMRDSAIEVRDSVTGSWAALASGVASSMNSFLNSVSAMVRSNRDLKKSHTETLSGITADHKATYADLSQQRLTDLADLNKSLSAGTMTRDEYAAEKLRIQQQYNTDVGILDQVRLDAIAAENKAYEDSKQTIWEILKEMGRNLMTAVRNELTLQGAKYAVLAAVALINPLTWAAAGVYTLQSLAAFAGAATLAIAGFAKGGIATSPTYGVVGEAGVSEGVIPLTPRYLSAIGRAIASASGFSREPLGATGIPGLAGGSSVQLSDTTYPQMGGVSGSGGGVSPSMGDTHIQIIIENPTIRDDSDIDKLVEGIEDSFEQTRRGLGWAGAT